MTSPQRRILAEIAAERRQHTAALIEDLEFLIRHGVGLSEAATRLGLTVHALEQRLHRARRKDLVRDLNRHDWLPIGHGLNEKKKWSA